LAVDTLATDGASVTLAPPSGGGAYSATGYTVFPGQDEIAVLYSDGTAASNPALAIDGYSLSGADLFHAAPPASAAQAGSSTSPVIGALGNGNVAYAWFENDGDGTARTTTNYAILTPSGSQTSTGQIINPNGYETPQSPLTFWPWGTGFILTWIAGKTGAETTNQEQVQQFIAPDGSHTGPGTDAPRTISPEAQAKGGPYNATVDLIDNLLQYQDSHTINAGVFLPNEPAHAITSVAVSVLTDGRFAIAYADSGTDYATVYDPSAKAFGPTIGLDWGGANGVHIVSLADGGFAVSWTNGGQYKGELIGADGSHGAVMSLTGDFAGLAQDGEAFTVGLNGGGQYVVQKYLVYSPGGTGGTGGSTGGSGSSVSTSDANYTAPAGVTTITLTGSNQTVTANNAGDTIFSDNSVNHLNGGTGADTFHLGRGGDIVAGGAGNDIFAYAETPWNGGQITDFQNGDKIDLTGLLARSGYQGSDPIADGYLKLTDSNGSAQIWSDTDGTGTASGWWLVATVSQVSSSSLHLHDGILSEDVVSGGGSSGETVNTSASHYTAGPNDAVINLTGSSGQTIDARGDTIGVTINSSDYLDTLIGSPQDDVFNIGRGGNGVTGGAGADTWVYSQVPWRWGTVGDFNPAEGDRIDVRGMIASTGYKGADPIADGYLRFVTVDGTTEIQANYNQSGNDGWWEVAYVRNFAVLHYDNGIIT
jgi:hypothetical protein